MTGYRGTGEGPRSPGEMFSSTHTRVCVCLVAHSCPALYDPMNSSPPGSSVHGDSSGKYTGVGCHALLQGILPAQGLNPVSHIAGRFFTV